MIEKNVALVNRFYESFKELNYEAMNNCYSNDIAFFDPVFGLLQGNEVKYMWEMLCKNAKDFTLTYGNIKELDAEYYTCDWEATYNFSKTGRKVVNKVIAHMKMLDGEIVEHSDGFSLHNWSKQAIGFSGWLLGWNSYYQQKIKNNAKRNLINFIEKHYQ